MNNKSLDDKEELVLCSFCLKEQDEVKQLIAGPDVYICNECVMDCYKIINEEKSTTSET